MLSPIKRKNKKGVSVVIGYILLISFAVVISTIVYQWLKSYVPRESLECPEGVSIFVKDYTYDCEANTLSLTLKNNGRFDLAGYYIHASESSGEGIATLDLSDKITSGGESFGGSVAIAATGNSFPPNSPGNEKINTFNLAGLGTIYFIELIPTRHQEIDGRSRFLSCSDDKIKEDISCSDTVCVPDCSGKECGLDPVCGESCGTCGVVGDVCDGTGTCVPQAECIDTCISRGYSCGTWEICGVSTDCGAEIGCDPVTEICNEGTGICEDKTYCGDGTVQTINDEGVEEECDDSPFPEHCIAPDEVNECTCETGFNPDGTGECVYDTTYNVEDYCVDLGTYSTGFCAPNLGQCTSQGGTLESGGDFTCTTGLLACCQP